MVKNPHKILCIVLCVALLVTAMMVGTVSAFASSGDKVYVTLDNGWSTVYCYMWNDSGNNGDWPGKPMTKVKDNVYSYTLSGDFNNIIFNNGSGGSGNQTGDMSYPGANKIYSLSGNSWGDYSGGGSNDPTTATTATTATKPTGGSGGGPTVYFKNTDNWSSPNCYMWNSDTDNNGAWPGKPMTKVEDNVYSYTASKSYSSCIFNGNGGSSQTGDLSTKDGYIYDYSTKQWSVYDTSEIRVKSYDADPAENIYTGMEVTLSAQAQSSSGTVTYKFSVTNSSGSTSVLAQNTSGTTAWMPTNAGSYTITIDFSDTAGHTNSRTIKLTVQSDASLTSPIIKSVLPGNLNFIKRNAATTVSVNAGGGKTGTNLLFYKYIVTDPNGKINTPYYTLNSSYNFTPTMLGKYTVDVFVQASDNSTVNKTYTYTATDNDVTNPTTATDSDVTNPTTATQPATDSQGYQKGDVNKDGKVNINDATYIQRYIARYKGFEYIPLELGDMNDDGIVSIKDATTIQRLINKEQ